MLTKGVWEGHFLSFPETAAVVEMGQGSRLSGLVSAPSLEASVGSQCKRGCTWVFPSKTALDRHDLVIHTAQRRCERQLACRDGQPAANNAAGQRDHLACNYIQEDGAKCSFVAPSTYYLRQHKAKTGHKVKRSTTAAGRPAKKRRA